MGKMNNKMDLPMSFRHNNEIITDKQQIANSLNDYYSKVGPETNRSVQNSKKDASYYLQKNKKRVTEALLFEEIGEMEVIEICKSINAKKSCDAFSCLIIEKKI